MNMLTKINPNVKKRLAEMKQETLDKFHNHFSPAFISELSTSSDADLAYLLIQILEPSIGSPIDYSDELLEAMHPITEAYGNNHSNITALIN